MNTSGIINKMQQHFIDCNNNESHKVLGPVYAHTAGPVVMSLVRALIAIKLVFEGLKEIFGKVALKVLLLPINLVAKISSKNTLNNSFSITRGVHSIAQACILGVKTPRVFLVNLASPNLVKVEQDLEEVRNEIESMLARHRELLNTSRDLEKRLQNADADRVNILKKARVLFNEKKQIEFKLLNLNQQLGGEETEFSLSLIDIILKRLFDKSQKEIIALQQDLKSVSAQITAQQVGMSSLQSMSQALISQNQLQERSILDLRAEIEVLQSGGNFQKQTIDSQALTIDGLREQVRVLQEQLQTQAESVRLASKPIEKENVSDSEIFRTGSQTRQQSEPTVNEDSADNNSSHSPEPEPKPSTYRRSLTKENASMADQIREKRAAMKAKRTSNQENKETKVQSKLDSQIFKPEEATDYLPEAFQGINKVADQFTGAITNQYNSDREKVKSDLIKDIIGMVKFGEIENSDQLREVVKKEVSPEQQDLLMSFIDNTASDEAQGKPFELAVEEHGEPRIIPGSTSKSTKLVANVISSADLYDKNFTSIPNAS